jgi:hypothetical protein
LFEPVSIPNPNYAMFGTGNLTLSAKSQLEYHVNR